VNDPGFPKFVEYAVEFSIALAATMIGVYYGQRGADRERRNKDAEEKSVRAARVKALLLASLKGAITTTWRAQRILRDAKKAPGIRVHAGFLKSHLAEAIDLYGTDQDRLEALLICTIMVEAANDRIDTVAMYDRMGIEPGHTQAISKEHAAQVTLTLTALADLDKRLEREILHLAPETQDELAKEREKSAAAPIRPEQKI
jgi:hypothetical protein